MKPSIAIIGHSHVECMVSALKHKPNPQVEIVNLRLLSNTKDCSWPKIGQTLKEVLQNENPDVLCLCISGNEHNVLGVLEHPSPFSVGDSVSGAVPEDSTRWFIPYQVMLDAFRHQISRLAAAIYSAFPHAVKLYLNPPPPVSDWEHILEYPGVFKDKLHLGPGPEALRLKLYQIQTVVLKELAEKAGAEFIEPPDEVLDERGFLARAYFNLDPTHGNREYGVIILDKILERAGLRT